jgi:hypothetical protein
MRLAALCHTEIAIEFGVLRTAVSSVMESVVWHSPSDTFHMEVVSELVAEFQKMEDQCLRLERPDMRICDLLLGPPISRARLVDHLDEAAGQLRVELVAGWEVDAELGAPRTSVVRAWDLVLDSADGPSSVAVSMSMMAVWSLTVSIGVLFCIGCCCVTFLRAEDQAGCARVQMQRGVDRG